MGVGSRGSGIPGGVTSPAQERPMSEMFNPHAPATAYEWASVVVRRMSPVSLSIAVA
jgi:hypothetical protein